jgi:hypothetical protein
MPSTILSDNGVTSNTSGIKVAGSNDGILELQTTTAGGAVTTAMTINTGQAVTFAQTANLPNTFGFKNRIINGGMVIDQRNAGAAVTGQSGYLVDRFGYARFATDELAWSLQQDSSAPTGFVNSVKVTITTAETTYTTNENTIFYQTIEGLNVADLGWGTANAKTVTLSFWVRSSLTGTFGGCLYNSAANRFYPFSYTISVADTWEQKSVTIAGDTTGTWLTTNGAGITVQWALGQGPDRLGTAGAWTSSNHQGVTGQVQVGSNLNATWYITGVQLEVGSTATSFDYRDYGRELAMCQRYYEQANMAVYSTVTRNSYSYHVPKRAYPSSVTLTTGTIINYYEDFASFSNVADAATTMKINAEL